MHPNECLFCNELQSDKTMSNLVTQMTTFECTLVIFELSISNVHYSVEFKHSILNLVDNFQICNVETELSITIVDRKRLIRLYSIYKF